MERETRCSNKQEVKFHKATGEEEGGISNCASVRKFFFYFIGGGGGWGGGGGISKKLGNNNKGDRGKKMANANNIII